jgi:hypothetical protein
VNENADPITWNADDFETGDRFAIPPQHKKVFTITGREDRGTLIEFKATMWSEIDSEDWEGFTFTFPADFPLSARKRLRTFKAKCMLCPVTVTTEIDTAFSTLLTVVCGKH